MDNGACNVSDAVQYGKEAAVDGKTTLKRLMVLASLIVSSQRSRASIVINTPHIEPGIHMTHEFAEGCHTCDDSTTVGSYGGCGLIDAAARYIYILLYHSRVLVCAVVKRLRFPTRTLVSLLQ